LAGKKNFFMKGAILIVLVFFVLVRLQAQNISSVISKGISTVIRAVDLQIQRFQTKTIGLQEAQRELENAMAATELDEIREWVERQRDLYGEYFQELLQAKTVVSDYHRLREAIARQEAILGVYQQGLVRFRQDRHFSAAELGHINSVFAAVLAESEENLERLAKAVGIGIFQMTDEQRLATIDLAADGMDKNYRDLEDFTQQAQLLSLQRAQDENDYLTLKKLYGL
jgi:hypothetical protein